MKPPYEQIIVLDFETKWDSKGYTLSKLTNEEYIRDARFKAFGLAWKYLGDNAPAVWVSERDLQEWADSFDWSRTAVLCHNAQFDVSVLSWKFGSHPCFIFDTLSMARALRGVEVGNSLKKLAEAFRLPPKGMAVHSTDGLDDLTPEIEKELADYCVHDVFLCEEIFNRLIEGYPSKELRLIDMTLKMYTNPMLELDPNMLTHAILEEKEKREKLLEELNISDSVLASNPKFAEVLTLLGVTPPTKKSKTTGKETLALAKNDAHFQALLHHEDEKIALLCQARLMVKSTLERTRAQRFLEIAGRGALPVPLNYYGAHTGRWSASRGSNINLQNMGRKSFLRKAVLAPSGCQLVVCDLSQIEPRVLAWLAGYDDLLKVFAGGGDAYATFGAQMFNIPNMTKDTHPVERQSSKAALLGCFGSQTPVLTKRGWVTLLDVRLDDFLWDGQEWVHHLGVVPQGEKEVLTAAGISATSDHKILTEQGWAEWGEVLANRTLLESALFLANLNSLNTKLKPEMLLNLTSASPPLKQKMQTYDIAYAGPRNRYTILISEGPLIVHNCGYQLGWASFAAQLLTGFLGAAPLRYTKAEARQLGVTAEKAQAFMNWEVNLHKMAEIPHTCTEEELLVHCIAAKEIIDKYRSAAQPIVDFWTMCQELIPQSLIGGREYTHKCITFKKNEIVLPSKLSLRYPDLKGVPSERNRVQWVYGEDEKKLYGGKLTENITQAVARCVMTDGMLRIQERYPCVLTVHDEAVVLVPELEVEEAETWVLQQMIKEPKYMVGIPLNAEAGSARRYGDAK